MIPAETIVGSSHESSSVKLFRGSLVTEEDAIVALMSLACRHRLTYACIGDVLKLVSSLLPVPNGLSVSLHTLLGRFVNFTTETVVRKFCGNCLVSLHDILRCTKPKCMSVRQPDATFIEIPLQTQIAEKMQGKV